MKKVNEGSIVIDHNPDDNHKQNQNRSNILDSDEEDDFFNRKFAEAAEITNRSNRKETTTEIHKI